MNFAMDFLRCLTETVAYALALAVFLGAVGTVFGAWAGGFVLGFCALAPVC